MENTDTNDACSLSAPDINEDSVDIYDDLDIGFSSNAEKSPPNASQLKDSMDLYEEIVTEEQLSRESSYAELQFRFQAAQNQIKELHRRLGQLEMQNKRLNSENCCLRKNISALLQTARQEVTRKDAEIQRLNQRSMKGRHQFHINNLRDQTSSSWTSTCSPSSRTPPSCSPPAPPPLSASTSREYQPSKKESNSTNQPIGSCIETRAYKASSHSHFQNLSTRQSESDKQGSKHREEKYHNHKLSQSTDRRYRTESNPNKNCLALEKIRSDKAHKDTRRKYESRSYKSKVYGKVEGHHRSDMTKKKTPETLLSSASSDGTTLGRDHKQDKAKFATSDSEHGTANSYSRDKRKIRTSYGHSRSLDSKDRIKFSPNQYAERYREFSKGRDGEQLSNDYQRKEAKRHEDETSRKHKKSSLSEMSREHEKESDQDVLDVCSKERQEKKSETLEGLSKQPKPTEKSSVGKSTPNRKLCFMETLNLTLSPIKRPVVPIDASQDVPTVDRVVENQPDHENSQPNIEDLCVIDELDSSELNAGLEDVAEQSLDISKSTHKSCDTIKDTQEREKSCSESDTGKPLEENSVKSTSADSDPLVKQITVHPTPQSPQSSLKMPQGSISKNDSSVNLASDSQVDGSGALEAADGVSDTPKSIFKQYTNNSLHKRNHGNNINQSVTILKPWVPESGVEPPKTTEKESLSVDSIEEGTTVIPSGQSTEASHPRSQQISPPIVPQGCQQGPVLPASSSSIQKKDACDIQDSPKDTDAVSSTISLESFPQEGLSLPEAIYVLTQTSEDANDSLATEPSCSTSCIGVSKVSSTTVEMELPEKYRNLTFTPKKSFSSGKSYENSVEPSSSVPLLHDEDSMMQTLCNLKRFPDAISPLRSPVRITKRSPFHGHGKPGHVKSLQNDFFNTAVDVNSKKLDVNKENKYPADHDMQNIVDKVSDHPSSLSDTELEEGEILSESDEVVPSSPVPLTKQAKLSPPVRNKLDHKTVLKRRSEDWCFVSKETSETAGASTRSPKSRFKTVSPAETKAAFSSIEEIMETFKLVRTEIRKKYMKLHKSFPKKSFYGMMDNFHESFLEFVDGAQFGQICSQAGELKSKIRKLIASVFSKVSNNGIVKRIFEQQASDLKQKLWDFVDVQIDFLFKDIHITLKSLCKPARAQADDKKLSGNEKVSRQPALKKPQCQQKEAKSAPSSLNRIKTCAGVPYRTGLGSRGKDIRITHVEKDTNVEPHPADCSNKQTVVDSLPPKNIPSTPEKNGMVSLIVSQNGSLLDKTDFEILTEQQTSSLTFNLVRDSQMGEIFKCLLQGSDLLETSGITGDSTAWSLSTPRKDGERLISITTPTKFDSPSKLLSPTRFDTPSKLIGTWSSISPRKMSSLRSKDQIPLNPALFDESCLLEVPSENKLMLQPNLPSQKSYSILAEDLAVSLTIPSPLKSDSHLSFLQPSSTHIMLTPDSVISAHISEDAVLDGEDATEQDIHLTLDTDNSSCGSSSSMASVALATSFVFQTDKPMQALVMEKSNDHFIVKIRQAAAQPDVTIMADDSLNQALRGEDQQHTEEHIAQETHEESRAKAALSYKSENGSSPSDAVSSCPEMFQAVTGSDFCLTQDESLTLTKDPCHQKEDTSIHQSPSQFSSLKNLPETAASKNALHSGARRSDYNCMQINQSSTETHNRNKDMQAQKCSSKPLHSEDMISASKTIVSDSNPHHLAESSETNQTSQTSLSHFSDLEREETEVSESERSLIIEEDVSSRPEKGRKDPDKGRKRKKHHEKPKPKRSRREEVEIPQEVMFNSEKGHIMSSSSPAALSPNSLSAKNLVRKKGEVVMTWTRDEDRTILVDLKTKGPSRETFSALSEKLNKPSGQIAHRFYQLMKLFKKQEKMDT